MNKRILIIKMAYDSFQKFYDHKFREMGIDVCTLENLLWPGCKQKILDVSLHKHIKKYAIDKQWYKYDLIIVFDAAYLVPAIALNKSKKSKLVLWMWNTVAPYDIKRIKIAKLFSSVWTFDVNDSKKYNLELNNQFYFYNTDTINDEISSDVFFVGADKGRDKILIELTNYFTKYGISVDLHLLKDNDKIYDKKIEPYIIDDYLDYKIVLNKIKSTRAVLDIVKAGQSGVTVRAIEAIFYGKKIITNNICLKNTDLYKTGNVYILNNEKISIQDFLKGQTNIYSESIKSQYTAENWLNRFGEFYGTGEII